MEDSAMKASKKKKSHASASPASPSPSTPDPINLKEEEDGLGELARPPGRKAGKARLRKLKSYLDEGKCDVSILSLFEKMQKKKLDVYKQSLATDADRLALNKERIAVDNARTEADNARTTLEKAKFEASQEVRRIAEEERIMMIEIEKLPPNQAMYYAARQKEILARVLGSSGSSRMQ